MQLFFIICLYNLKEREEWRKAFQDVEHTDQIRDSIVCNKNNNMNSFKKMLFFFYILDIIK